MRAGNALISAGYSGDRGGDGQPCSGTRATGTRSSVSVGTALILSAMNLSRYVVTGASTGIGRACVEELVRVGAHVWATVRTDTDEEALRRDYPDAVSVLRMDLTDPASVRAAGERVRAAGPLRGLVNNAGVAVPARLSTYRSTCSAARSRSIWWDSSRSPRRCCPPCGRRGNRTRTRAS